MASEHSRGLYFEEFSLGQIIESPARTVTETDVVQFAGLSGDFNQLHTDKVFAKDTVFGERIAHGLLTLSIASGLAARAGLIEGTVQAFVGLTWKFKKSVLIGDTVRLRGVVDSLRPMPSLGSGRVVIKVSVLNQYDEVVQAGEWTLMMTARGD